MMQTARQSNRLLRSTLPLLRTTGRPTRTSQIVPACRRCESTSSSHPLAGQDSFNQQQASTGLAGSSHDRGTTTRVPPTELLTVLEETIKTHGPLPVPRFMALCLNHPTLGYYTTRTVFGKEGDFITSPEISQVFGELLGIWYVTQWLQQGAPKKVRVVELGPGRGTLLADVLRTFKSLPAHSSPPVTSIHLVEQSEALQGVQKEALRKSGFGETPVYWHRNVEEVPKGEDEFTVAIAHEFFDALPIHIFENTEKGWREVLVDIADPKSSVLVSSEKKEPLRLVLSPTQTPASALYSSLAQALLRESPIAQSPTLHSAAPSPQTPLLNVDTTLPPPPSPSLSSTAQGRPGVKNLTAERFARLPIGSRIEISPSSYEIARGFANLVEGGGAGLIIDYGDSKAFGRSWRGFRKHQVVDPLTEPGHTDLTANVDFSYLAEALSEFATPHGPLPQSAFLTSLGLAPRLAALMKNATSEERKKEIDSSGKRLIDGLGMGGQYKVMGITPKQHSEKGKGAKEECYPFDLEGI
ncbi:class I SAM-dependent methyltransferase [Sporobolomyces salmoneus]|uniref:class I SAM-dependent methyltransferase n=1 Tax=Sporobolomyces salmoneus TaxID=183962 RepID=UPI0031801604